MIQPDGVCDAAIVERQRRPAAIAGSVGGLECDRRFERPAAVTRPCGSDLCGCRPRGPQHDDLRFARSAGSPQRHARRQFASEPCLAGGAVHLHGGAKGSAAVATDRDKDVGRCRFSTRPTQRRQTDRHWPPMASRSTVQQRRARSARERPPHAATAPTSSGERASRHRLGPQHRHASSTRFQKLARNPNWNDRGSPTAVICPNVGRGLVGYAPDPKLALRVSTLTTVGEVEPLDQRLEFQTPGHPERAAHAHVQAEEVAADAGVPFE